MKATRTSTCMVCEEIIYEGDEITLIEEENEWVHEQCAIDGGYVDEEV